MTCDPELGFVLRSLPACSRVVEIGCGLQGRLTRVLAEQFSDLTALDPCLSLRQIARLRSDEQLRKVRFLPVHLEEMPRGMGKFDVAVMAHAVHHIAPGLRPQFLAAVAAVLHTPGQFLVLEDVDVPCGDLRQQNFQTYHRSVIALDRAAGRPHFPLLNPGQLVELLESTGLRVHWWRIVDEPRPVQVEPERLSTALLELWKRREMQSSEGELPVSDVPAFCERMGKEGVATPPYVMVVSGCETDKEGRSIRQEVGS